MASEWKGTCETDAAGHPTIRVGGETVPEAARQQAAFNMRLNHSLRDRIVAALGEAEARRRYPEGWWTDEQVAEAERAQSPE